MPTDTMRTLAAIALLALAAAPAAAQRSWEFRISGGGFLPTGTLRQHVDDAQLTAAQISWISSERLALTGSFSWARSRDLVTTGTPKLDVFTSDVGAEVRSGTFVSNGRVSLATFAGLGAGVRSYNYRRIDAPATHNAAGYASVGGEIGIGRTGIRLEARNYVSGFKPLAGAGTTGTTGTRNDVVINFSLRFNIPRGTN